MAAKALVIGLVGIAREEQSALYRDASTLSTIKAVVIFGSGIPEILWTSAFSWSPFSAVVQMLRGTYRSTRS